MKASQNTLKKRRALLVKALRSGKYKQGFNALHMKDEKGRDKYCCLGVACEVAIANGAKVKAIYAGALRTYYYDKCPGVLPVSVKNWYGFQGSSGRFLGKDQNFYLSELNDSGTKFKKIADIIESEPLGMFK